MKFSRSTFYAESNGRVRKIFDMKKKRCFLRKTSNFGTFSWKTACILYFISKSENKLITSQQIWLTLTSKESRDAWECEKLSPSCIWKLCSKKWHKNEVYSNENVVTSVDREVGLHWTVVLLIGWNSCIARIPRIFPKLRKWISYRKRFSHLKSEVVHF